MNDSDSFLRLKRCTMITRAVRDGHDVPIAVSGRAWTNLVWMVLNEYGVAALVVADTLEDAQEAYCDSLSGIDASELPEAYGCEDHVEFETRRLLDILELRDGYQHQANAGGGTGIVDVGHCLNIVQLAKEQASGFGLQIREWDTAQAEAEASEAGPTRVLTLATETMAHELAARLTMSFGLTCVVDGCQVTARGESTTITELDSTTFSGQEQTA